MMPDASILLADGLTATEKLLLLALVQMDKHDGNGTTPSNADLARICCFKTDGPDRGQKVVRTLLKGVKDKGYVRVEVVPWTDQNPTGRTIHILPKAMGWEVRS